MKIIDMRQRPGPYHGVSFDYWMREDRKFLDRHISLTQPIFLPRKKIVILGEEYAPPMGLLMEAWMAYDPKSGQETMGATGAAAIKKLLDIIKPRRKYCYQPQQIGYVA